MPRGDKVQNRGTNSQGNDYTAYKDGTYAYTNNNSDGPPAHYYNAGNGHSFYRKPGPDGYSWHQNDNQGFRNITPNNSD